MKGISMIKAIDLLKKNSSFNFKRASGISKE